MKLWFHKWDKTKHDIKTTKKRKIREFNRNLSRAIARRTFRYRNVNQKSKEIMKEEKWFTCDKETKPKKRSRHLETLGRVEPDNKSATLIDAMKKNEDFD